MTFADFAESEELAVSASGLSHRLLRSQVSLVRRQVDAYYDRVTTTLDIDELGPLKELPQIPIFGVAIVATFEGQRTALLVANSAVLNDVPDANLSETRIFMPSEVPIVMQLAEAIFDLGNLPDSTVVVGLPEPVPQFNAGRQASCQGNLGTLGASIDYNGQTAIMTAGHVVPSVGLPVRCRKCSKLGQSVFTMYPGMIPAHAIAPDVAVIIPDNAAQSCGRTTFKKRTKTSGGDRVDLIGSAAQPTTQIMGYCEYILCPSMAGMWGDTYFTTAGFSTGGDSGAPVVSSGTDELLGHLVGASGQATSYIQSIDYQLAACGASLI